ncbi:ras guanine nucleotide exchange factor B [Lucilia cuprina]|uniref:ras guanine nucleotide exchange factor B n=1 Tax=Lucilia cuprina TaxID=7375 RepID=UPI001F056B34|nr:ras guanine nucleotide exchange factor B [Lucilia cuprina]XP_046807034.1 ras guanine nucleotide exchange factor B [Lucilia cuprina]XP_046807035.1 ras guanine nucleotide exchange factor B [Lucilia cuprina]
MINNICETNKSAKTDTAFKATTTAAIVDNRHNDGDESHDVATANNNNNSRGGIVQTTYGHGIWYSEIIDGASNTNNNKIFHHQQQYYNNANNNNSNNNNKENAVNRNVWSTTRSDVVKDQQQKQHQTLNNNTNNECDIIIVDIENDDNDNVEVKGEQQPIYSVPQKFFINANMHFSKNKATSIYDSKHIANDGKVDCKAVVNNNTVAIVNGDEEDDDDSFASMETLSDNVSIWIDGEKHWVAGVDANTTCSDLIWALLNYQNGQQVSQQQTQHQHAFALATTMPSENGENIATSVINKTNSNQCEKHIMQQQHQRQQQQLLQQPPKAYDTNVIDFSFSKSTNEDNSNMQFTGKKPNIPNTANTNNTTNPNTTTSNTITTTINQSMPINTKENCKIIPNSTSATATTTAEAALSATPIISSSAPVPVMTPPPPTLLPLTLPPGITTVSQLATEYVIVKQYHHCEEYLDGSTKVFDVLPRRDGSHRKECELLLRHLGPAPAVYINNTTPQLSSLISTDKDSGMGSPVGSARSAKFRRRKHKSSQWLAQANTLHPKLSRCTMGNERLMKIILAQDETIQRQLSLLREKERQITKIEEEKHRKRERELGKNYLLETYLNGLDEAECEPEIQDGEEIFIDEPYHRATTIPAMLQTTTTTPRTTNMPAGATLAAGAVTDNIPSAAEAFNIMAKHKLKDKEVKKEKKKKRHKEKSTIDEKTPAKDFNLKTNKNKDKEKVDKQQQHHHHQQHELNAIDGKHHLKDNEQEIEMQMLWLEKIYTLNKQLQKEEELAAKLHGKVRKHQLRMAQQTQREAQMEIEKLDNNLALQCGDIRKVEANLMQTNEQLQKKLLILERLSIEYLQEQQEKDITDSQQDNKQTTQRQGDTKTVTKDLTNPLINDTNTILSNLEKSIDIEKLSLNNIKSKEEVIQLEKIIAKPSIQLCSNNKQQLEPKQAVTMANNPAIVNMKTTAFPLIKQQQQQQQRDNQRLTNEIRANSINGTSNSTNRNITITNTDNQLEQQQQQQLTTPPIMSTTVTANTLHSESALSNSTMSTSCMFIDKNMLSSLHVQNAKTIKKQMFHTQTTTAATTTTPPAATSLLPQLPTQPPPQPSAFPKQKFQHILQQHQQHMPMASTFLTSRPQNFHQIPATNIVLVQQPSPFSATSSSNFTTSPSSSSSLTSSSVPVPPAATVSILKASQPPTSASPSPSIMAMNTVDISQLGTLV